MEEQTINPTAQQAEQNTQQPTTSTPEVSGGQGSERMFTQDEVNKIVSERLARGKHEAADFEQLQSKCAEYEAQIAAMQQREQAATRVRVLKEAQLPDGLGEWLRGETEDELRRDARKLFSILGPLNRLPPVPLFSHEPAPVDGSPFGSLGGPVAEAFENKPHAPKKYWEHEDD